MIRSQLRLVALSALALASHVDDADACKTPPPCVAMQPFATDAEATRSLAATDPALAARAVFTLASSTTAKSSVEAAGRALLVRKYAKAILDVPDGRRCVMPAILRALAGNPHGRAPFVALIKSQAWAETAATGGTDLPEQLLRASAVIRPPPPEVVQFWTAHALPNDGWSNVTAMVLPENGSPDAITAFQLMLKNAKHDVETRKAWLHTTFIEHRNEEPLLAMVRRLLVTPLLISSLRHALAEAVFDYRQEWYDTCPGPTPPTVAQYSFLARARVREIAALVAKADGRLVAAMTKMLTDFDKP